MLGPSDLPGALGGANLPEAKTDAFGAPLRFNSTKGEAFGVLATAPGIHAAAVERLSTRARQAVRR